MKTVILTCDRCCRVLKKSEDLSEIKVIFTNPSLYSYSSGKNMELESKIKSVEWCDKCMAETGFAAFRTVGVSTLPPTLEDFIRDIMHEVANEVVRNNQP